MKRRGRNFSLEQVTERTVLIGRILMESEMSAAVSVCSPAELTGHDRTEWTCTQLKRKANHNK